MASLLIKNGYIITPKDDGMQVIENGAIAITEDRIVAMGPTDEVTATFSGDITIDASHHAILPGFIDAHIHTPLSLLRGLAQDVAESEWMHKAVDPFSRHITKESAVIGSKLCVLEALKSGTTCFCDYGYHMSEIVEQVYRPMGVRANVCSTVNELGPQKRESGALYQFDSAVGEKKLRDNRDLINRWHGSENGRITCLFGPQAADMMSKELLLHVKELAAERGLSIHMHVAQGGRERTQMVKRYGKSTVDHLREISYLDSQLIAVHCHDTTPEELQILANSGVRMVGCPGSIGFIDGIVPPLHSYLQAGGIVALGSDQSPPAGNTMLAQMKYAAILNKVKHTDPRVLPAWQVLRMATIDAAKCHGLEFRIGSLELEKKADLILIDLKQFHLTPSLSSPVRNLIPNIVYHANGSEVSTVIVDGKVIVKEGRVVTIDEQAVLKEAQQAAESIANSAEIDYKDIDSPLTEMMRTGKL
ncbi:MAG: amidohydrolase [Candidatus Thorarchaeota archaeon]